VEATFSKISRSITKSVEEVQLPYLRQLQIKNLKKMKRIRRDLIEVFNIFTGF
jgi:hypothetical protein